MSGRTWTPERVEMLLAMVSEGYSGGKIAKQLGAPITRSAVMGKVNRMGLSLATSSHHVRSPGGRKKMVPLLPPPRTLTERELRAVEPSRNVTMMELGNDTCRWPIWSDNLRTIGGGTLFCGNHGADNANKRPYCPHHEMIAWRKYRNGGFRDE